MIRRNNSTREDLVSLTSATLGTSFDGFFINGLTNSFAYDSKKPNISILGPSKYSHTSAIPLHVNVSEGVNINKLKWIVTPVKNDSGISFSYVIKNSVLFIKDHFCGKVKISVSSEDFPGIRFSRILTITCDEIASYEYSVSDISQNFTKVGADETSIEVSFKGIIKATYLNGNTETIINEMKETVEFPANTTSSEVTRSGSINWNGVEVPWEVVQSDVDDIDLGGSEVEEVETGDLPEFDDILNNN